MFASVQDERSLQRYVLALEKTACQPERERLRRLEREEAEAVVQVAKAEVRGRRPCVLFGHVARL